MGISDLWRRNDIAALFHEARVATIEHRPADAGRLRGQMGGHRARRVSYLEEGRQNGDEGDIDGLTYNGFMNGGMPAKEYVQRARKTGMVQPRRGEDS